MDAISEPGVERVVVMTSAQVGKTEVINNVIGFHIAQDPSPILVLQPTLEMAETWSKDRLAPMLRDTPVLKDKVAPVRARDAGNTLLHKNFTGGHVTVVGANSPSGLASRPIRIVLADEIDRYPVSAGTEGDPLSLAIKRTGTFWNRRVAICSTPTIKGYSRIEEEWLRSDQRRYFVPCSYCAHEQHLLWAQVKWPEGRPQDAAYACEGCGALWNEAERLAAVRWGKWKATAPPSRVVGFHLNELYSPWSSLPLIAMAFLDAKSNPETLKTWINTVLGETWEDKGETVDPAAIENRGEIYDYTSLPDSIIALAAGVDVQDDRLEVQIIGWGHKEEAWVCRYEVIRGDPAQDSVWEELDALLLDPGKTESGRGLRIRAACIDVGGHHGERVLAFCKTRWARKVFPIKGRAGAWPVWPKNATRSKTNQPIFLIGVDTAKDAIYGRLKIAAPGPSYVHFPAGEGFDKEYFKQLTSERVQTRYREGRPYRVWVVTKGVRNEALDTFVYALAAMKALRIRFDRINAPENIETAPATEAKTLEQREEIRGNDIAPLNQGRRESSWLDVGGSWL